MQKKNEIVVYEKGSKEKVTVAREKSGLFHTACMYFTGFLPVTYSTTIPNAILVVNNLDIF